MGSTTFTAGGGGFTPIYLPNIPPSAQYASGFGTLFTDMDQNDQQHFNFTVPSGVTTVSARIQMSSSFAKADFLWELETSMGANGENYHLHTALDATTTRATPAASIKFEIDVSYLLVLAESGDQVGIRIKNIDTLPVNNMNCCGCIVEFA